MIIEKGEQIIKGAVDEGKIPGATYAFISEYFEEYGNYGYKQIVPSKIPNNVDTLSRVMVKKMIDEDNVKKIEDIVKEEEV